jgi:hypothetical protein
MVTQIRLLLVLLSAMASWTLLPALARCEPPSRSGDALMCFGTRWSDWSLPTACLFCLGRLAEHQLHCRHAICDTCVMIFGRPTRGVEYHRDLVQCPLCQKSFQLTVRQLPPTKRPVVITLVFGWGCFAE